MTSGLANIIDKYQGVAPLNVISAVHNAAQKTGADFAYLMEKACTESSFDTKAASRHSSARGLYQFIESTWLTMVKNHGEKFGLKAYADQIEMKNGKPCVSDCKVKDSILKLRSNPEISALMAGVFSEENASYLERHTKSDVGPTELYLAHFLGAGGAAQFINARAENGAADAAKLLPRAARANKAIFYDRATGRPRSLDQIYQNFAAKFDGETKTNNTDAARTPSTQAAGLQASPLQPAEPAAVRTTPAPAAPSAATGRAPSFQGEVPRRLSPAVVMAMADMQETLSRTAFSAKKDRYGYNS